MLEQPHRLRLDKLIDHIAQDSTDGIETFVRMANIRQPGLVKEDFLDDEDGDGLGELGSGLHYAQAERDNLSRQKEVDDSIVIVLLCIQERFRGVLKVVQVPDRKTEKGSLP